jgi:hypothetical protein
VPLASEVTTWEEQDAEPGDGVRSMRLRSRVRTNAEPERLKRRLEKLGLFALAEGIERYETNWHWSGTGQGYEILWRDGTTFTDLRPLARL